VHERRAIRDAEQEREDASLQAPPPLDSAAQLIQLQRAVGNQAVTAMLARDTTAAAPPAPAPAVDPEEQAFDDAVKAGDWAKAAAQLVKLKAPVPKLSPLTVDQLRLLQDAMVRGGSSLGGAGSAMQMAIAIELQSKGVPAAKLAAGAAFGKLESSVAENTSGDKAAGKDYAYKINITFTPDTAVVDADEIGFIQTVRLVDTATGANKDPEETNKKRQTASATSVDRLGGKEQGWYGMKDDGTGGGTLTTWTKTAPATPAKMMDRPSWNQPNTTWQFETMVVCRAGTDAGKVYAVITWGFTIDNDLKLTELARTITNKQTTEATAAVGKWNDQTAGPAADRNAPGQKSLPALK
jgi:hypothetical protein